MRGRLSRVAARAGGGRQTADGRRQTTHNRQQTTDNRQRAPPLRPSERGWPKAGGEAARAAQYHQPVKHHAAAAIIALLAALVLAGCAGSSAPQPTPAAQAHATSPAGLPTTTLRVAWHTIAVEVAADEASRERGLSGRAALPPDAGMLFDMGQVMTPRFWMKDMRFALDLVWIGADKRVAGVSAGVQPQPGVPDSALRLYASPAPVRYVLEVDAGAAQRLGLRQGAQVAFDLPSPALTATPATR